MEGIISLIDHESDQMVRNLWQHLEIEFGIKQTHELLAPHISWHVAEAYRHDRLKNWIIRKARETSSFPIQSSGLGIFLTPSPVLYLSLSVTLDVLKIHEEVFSFASTINTEPNPYYQPSIWIPHITLAQGEILIERMGDLLPGIRGFQLNREIIIDNFAFVCATSTNSSELCRIDFGEESHKHGE